MTDALAFFDEFLGTTVLIIVVLAINDKKNNPPPGGLAPLALFLLVLGIGASIGMQTGLPPFSFDNHISQVFKSQVMRSIRLEIWAHGY
jgi:hypothetical protein